jgi:hypothetical protein
VKDPFGTYLNETTETPPVGGGSGDGATAPVPGTSDGGTPDPSAETQTTENQGPPGPVPYERFKEVNDQLRPFKEFTDAGYDVDSLRQLTEWDGAFSQDGVGTWIQMSKVLDLPDEIKEAIDQHLGGSSQSPTPDKPTSPQPGTGETQQTDEAPPPWAEKILSKFEAQEEAEAEAARSEVLDNILEQWGEKDKEDGLEPLSEKKMLELIQLHAPNASSQEQILERARSSALEFREHYLGAEVQRRPGTAPLRVPGSGAPPAGERPKPKTLAEATALAKAQVAAGVYKIGSEE